MLGLFDTINTVSIILFIVGMVFLMIELFTPGIGIFGGVGILALILCIVFQAETLAQGLLLFLILGVVVTILILIVARSFRKGRIYRSALVLKDNEDKEEGYVSTDNYARLVGKKGITVTPLRPAGTARIDGEKADVVTDGEFIPAESEIEVLKVVGRRIIVKKVDA